jgi:hypothetical protein
LSKNHAQLERDFCFSVDFIEAWYTIIPNYQIIIINQLNIMSYSELASQESVANAAAALTERNFEPIVVATKAEALEKIKELIPQGASVGNGASRTLEEIGYIEYLKSGMHGWDNLHEKVLAEQDPEKKAALRKATINMDYYLGSVHALAETGQMVIASASGSQLPPIAFTAQNVIFVVSTQKIVPTLEEAMRRVREYVYPLEDARMKSTGAAGSMISKMLILEREPAFMGRKVRVILVNEKLGF